MDLIKEHAQTAEWFKAIAEPSRLAIITLLSSGPKSVGDIAASLGARVVNISHHLGQMRAAGVLTSEKDGRFVIYKLKGASARSGSVVLRHESGATISIPVK